MSHHLEIPQWQPVKAWEDAPEGTRDAYRDLARAALDAVRTHDEAVSA